MNAMENDAGHRPPDHLDETQLQEFEQNGLLVLRSFYQQDEVDAIRKGIWNVIGQMLKKYGLKDVRGEYRPDNFDAQYLDLIASNRAWGGEVYDAVKQIPGFIRLLSSLKHEQVFSELRRDSIPGIAAGGYGIRIDNPFEDKYRTHWHQEYPAQLRSVDGLVFWSPLVAVSESMGPVEFCLRSHTQGPLPVCSDESDEAGRTAAYALKLKDEQSLIARFDKVAPLLNPCDLVVIDFSAIHRSGVNRSSRARWSMQFRYFNFRDPVGTAHGWKGSYAAGIDFRAIHPELFFQGQA